MMQPISAPMLVPGTQQEPTTPSIDSSSSSNSSSSNRIPSLGSGPLYHPNHNPRDNYHHHHHSNSANNVLAMAHQLNNNPNSGLRRFPSIGNTKKLSQENSTLRAKITELERYLTGLKEELILAHRQIHAKNLESKIAQERKAVEIHELGQHIQRCEFDLLAKTAECETLQNKLQYQTKEQMTKLKHINLLENEIMDYRRMSILSGGAGGGAGAGANSTNGSTAPSTSGNLGGFRNSRSSTELTESVRSSTVLQDGNSSTSGGGSSNVNNNAETLAQMKELKEENARKDERIQSLVEQIEKLKQDLARWEQQQQQTKESSNQVAMVAVAAESMVRGGDKINVQSNNNTGDTTVSGSTSSASFNTASAHGAESAANTTMASSSFSSLTTNSVGYDMSVEHPKLIARYQALRIQHAQASEYVDNLESENRDLKVQLLDVTVVTASSSPFVSSEPTLSTLPSDTNHHNNKNSAASRLTPVDTDLSNQDYYHHTRESTLSNSPSPPTSATMVSTSGSPSPVVAPILTQKSSLRYSRDGQVSPTTTAEPGVSTTTTIPVNA